LLKKGKDDTLCQPCLQSKKPDPGETLDWLQERRVLKSDERVIELVM
jgi:hypothetical protein